MMEHLRHEVSVFLLALQFMTRLPLPRDIGFTQERFASAVRYYPLVGFVVGVIAALAYWVGTSIFNPELGVLLSMAATLLVTGAFHEDGLADTFDSVGGRDQAHALAIMKDSRIGTYGTAALVMVLAIKAVALGSLPAVAVVLVLTTAHTLSRLSSVLVIASSTYAREEGTGKPTAEGIDAGGLIVALLTGVAALLVIAIGFSVLAAGCAVLGLAAGHIFIRFLFERRLGGYTGDTLGSVQQVSEIGIYLGLLAWL